MKFISMLYPGDYLAFHEGSQKPQLAMWLKSVAQGNHLLSSTDNERNIARILLKNFEAAMMSLQSRLSQLSYVKGRNYDERWE